MHLVYCLTAGLLVKAVNILGDDPVKLPFFLHLSQFDVRSVGKAMPRVHFLAVEFKKYLRLMVEAAAAEKVFGLVPVEPDVVLIVKAVLTSEVRNAALCGNARAAKESNML